MALHKAVLDRDVPQINNLLNEGVDINATDGHNNTPLIVAVESAMHRDSTIIRLLLAAGADPNVPGSEHRTPLFVATQMFNPSQNYIYPEVITLLLENGADPNIPDANAVYPLTNVIGLRVHLTYEPYVIFVAESLLRHGANPNVANAIHGTELHHAVANKKVGVTIHLCENGADVNARNQLGETPLHVAAKIGALEVAQELINAGADLDIRNNEGKRAERLAIENRFPEIAKLISQSYSNNAWKRRGPAVKGKTMASVEEMGEIDAAIVIPSVLRSVAEAAGVALTPAMYSVAYTPAYDAYMAALEEGTIRAKAAATIAAIRVISAAVGGAGAAANQGGGRRRHRSRRAAKTNRRSTRGRVTR